MTVDLNKTLGGVINRMIARALAGVHTVIPARVSRVNKLGSAIRSIDCFPLIKYQKDVEGELVVESLSELYSVPVVQPGSGGAAMTFPVAVGDTVLLGFSEAAIDKWKTLGGMTDPGDFRRHHIADAVAILGLRDFAHALVTAPDNATTWGFNGIGLAKIVITETQIKLGESAVEPTYKANAHNTLFSELILAIATAMLEVPTVGTTIKGAIEAALTTYNTALAPTLTTMVKVQ